MTTKSQLNEIFEIIHNCEDVLKETLKYLLDNQHQLKEINHHVLWAKGAQIISLGQILHHQLNVKQTLKTHDQHTEGISTITFNDDYEYGAVALILNELKRAKELHPDWPKDNVYAAAIVAEEAGELLKEAMNLSNGSGDSFSMQKEAIQTGVTSLRFLTNFNREQSS